MPQRIPPVPPKFYEVHEERINRFLTQNRHSDGFTMVLRENYNPNHHWTVNLKLIKDIDGSMEIIPAKMSDLQVILDWNLRNHSVALDEFE